MSAVKKLTDFGTPDTIPYLIKALGSFDLKVADAALKSLHSLKNKNAIDAFCNIWYNTREKNLEEIITTVIYIAEKPLNIRVVTALKAGKTELCDNADSIEFLVALLSDKDLVISQNAEKALHSLKNKDAIDAFCNIWYKSREKKLEGILISEKYIAEKPLNIRMATALKAGKTELCDNADSVEFLVALLSDKDPKISQNAEKAIRTLKNKDAIDAFCNIWYNTREKKLEGILISEKYIAEKPLEIRVVTAMKAGKTELCENAASVEFLVTLLSDKDPKISQNAEKAIRTLKNKDAIDTFCNIWYNTREKRLDNILTAEKYIAEKPLNIRVATALKAGKTELCDNADSIEFLLALFSDKDLVISQNAEKALRSLKNKDAIAALCQGIISGILDDARAIALDAGFQPKPIGMRCLYFVITGQIEKYLELDFEFQYLRPEYQAACDAIQLRVRSAIQQSNDHRLMGLFGEVRKKFVAKDLTLHEAQLMLDIYARNKQPEEIFALLFFAPLPVIVNAIDALSKAKWQPHDDDRTILMENLVKTRKTLGNKPETFPDPEVVLGPVFQKWIEIGRKQYVLKTEVQLREYINSGTPPEAVSALSALVAKNKLQPADHDIFKKHPHWLVRMAYMALCTVGVEEKEISKEGGVYWIEKIHSILSYELMQVKPVNLTPDDLNQLSLKIENAGKSAESVKNWALLLVVLSGYILRNTIAIGSYEKQIEDTAIGIDTTSSTHKK